MDCQVYNILRKITRDVNVWLNAGLLSFHSPRFIGKRPLLYERLRTEVKRRIDKAMRMTPGNGKMSWNATISYSRVNSRQ